MYRHFFKRIIDFFIAFVALAILFFPLLIIAIWLYFANKGAGVFFTQPRPGKDGKIFKVIKFKSMTDECDESGCLLPNEMRITRVGSFLRKTSLDELPQLFNVLVGNMSLIGPRPLRVEYLQLYSKKQAQRHNVRPGITGWAQVNGRNAISWTKKFEFDVWYVNNMSFLLDLKILFMTILKVLKHSDINSSDDKIGIEKFNGYN